jgi:copper transport protein
MGGVAFSVMKRASALARLVLALASTAALAHAHLEKASPADGSIITTAPQSVVLEFSEPARLATLSITRDGGSPRKLAPLPQQPQQRIAVTLPELLPGTYVVSWRVVGADGHVVPGQIRFTLRR